MVGILGVDAGLDRVAARHVPRRHELGDAVGALAGQPQHLLDQVDPVYLLGDRVLHLQPRVHLKERRLLPGRVVHELDGPGRAVGDGRGEVPRRLVQLAAQRRRQPGGRGLLDDLLVAALKRAVPVAEHHDLPGPVAEDLDLHVPGLPHQPLEEDAGGGEVGSGEPLDPGERVGHLALVVTGQHADAAPAAGGLDHDGKADPAGLGDGLLGGGQQPGAGHHRDADGAGERTGRVLRAERLQVRWGRPDERESRFLHLAREVGVLGQEPVPGVDSAGASRTWRRRGCRVRSDKNLEVLPFRSVLPRRPRGRAARRYRPWSRRRPCAGRGGARVRMTRRAISPRLLTRTVSNAQPLRPPLTRAPPSRSSAAGWG